MSELNLKFFKGQFDFYQSKGLSIYLFKYLEIQSYGTHTYMIGDIYALEPSKINDSRFNFYKEKEQLDKAKVMEIIHKYPIKVLNLS